MSAQERSTEVPRAARKAWAAGRLGVLPLAVPSRILYGLTALAVFILALELIKGGAAGLIPFLERLSVEGGVNTLGFGWLAAYVVMSGSPVAAISLSLFSADVLTEIEAFFMINGSRLGASLIVLVVGFVLYLRGRRYPDGIYIGVIALIVTATTYIPAMFVGRAILETGWLDQVRFPAATELHSVINAAYGPARRAAVEHLPGVAVFALGASLLWSSFQIFDRALPQADADSQTWQRIIDFIHQRYAMFVVGLLVTAVTLSVAVSLTILVPLAMKGYVRRTHVIPYVMGANISTFVDTLFASLLLGAPSAFTIVLVQMLSVSLVSLLIIVFLYPRYSRLTTQASHLAARNVWTLAAFLTLLFVVPLALLLS